MKPKILLLVLFVAAASATATWFVARHVSAPTAAASAAAAGRKILYYQSPMHPWIKSDKPGKCPICNMDMVPIYENAEGTNTGFGLKLNADSVNVANVQTVLVQQRAIFHTLRVAGSISANSRQAAWFEFTAYERDLAWLKTGQTFDVNVLSAPGKSYTAQIKLHGIKSYADVNFDTASGSTTVRAEILNPPVEAGDFGANRLFSGLYANASVIAKTEEVLTVPRSAVLSPGAEPVVYVDTGGNFFEPRKVKLGRIGDEYVEVLAGLKEDERVVTSGNLLIDAETQISKSSDN
jgi:multidrug efflux pump subunit AcrA (membrane-fusion protein)